MFFILTNILELLIKYIFIYIYCIKSKYFIEIIKEYYYKIYL